MTTAESPSLPELDEDRLAAIERDVFARIGEERRRTRTRRRATWIGAGSAAAVVVTALVIAPMVTSSLSTVSTSAESVAIEPQPGGIGPEIAVVPGDAAGGSADSSASDGLTSAEVGAAGRETIASGSATVYADDVAAAADEIGAQAEARGGYVESVNVAHDTPWRDAVAGGSTSDPPPYPGGDGWIVVRVPSGELAAAIDALSDVGTVTASQVSQQDVTDQTVDLRARIASSEASVARLTELMSQAGSVSDLIAAESALAERQATLESDRQQLAMLESQVQLSSLSVQIMQRTEVEEVDPAGFPDGLVAGWNSLVATFEGLVIALGFLLPWLVVIAIVGAVVWGVVTLVRRIRRSARRGGGTETGVPGGAA